MRKQLANWQTKYEEERSRAARLRRGLAALEREKAALRLREDALRGESRSLAREVHAA